MLSVTHCEKILLKQGIHLSQKETEQLRTNLYLLASIFIKQYLSETTGQTKKKCL
jgi:hypothetical protein